MNRRFPSDFLFPQKEQAGSESRSQDTTSVRCIGQLSWRDVTRMYVSEARPESRFA
jgi:hypothetical protein